MECRQVVDSMWKVGEAEARLKQLEVSLDAAELDKQNALNEAKMAKEMAEFSKSEVKRIESMVSMTCQEMLPTRENLGFVVYGNLHVSILTKDQCSIKYCSLLLKPQPASHYLKPHTKKIKTQKKRIKLDVQLEISSHAATSKH